MFGRDATEKSETFDDPRSVMCARASERMVLVRLSLRGHEPLGGWSVLRGLPVCTVSRQEAIDKMFSPQPRSGVGGQRHITHILWGDGKKKWPESEEFSEIFNHVTPLETIFCPQNAYSHHFNVFTPSPRAPVSGSLANLCGSSMYSLRSIQWYPSHLLYAKG